MSRRLFFQRTLAVLVGVMLLALLLFVGAAVTQYRPMAEALFETDRQWVDLQEATTARAKAANALIADAKDLPGAVPAIAEFLRVRRAFDMMLVDRQISPFNIDRAGDFERGDRLVRRAVVGLLRATEGSPSKSRPELEAADREVIERIHAYNQSVEAYNAVVHQFPRQYVASPFGFYDKQPLNLQTK